MKVSIPSCRFCLFRDFFQHHHVSCLDCLYRIQASSTILVRFCLPRPQQQREDAASSTHTAGLASVARRTSPSEMTASPSSASAAPSSAPTRRTTLEPGPASTSSAFPDRRNRYVRKKFATNYETYSTAVCRLDTANNRMDSTSLTLKQTTRFSSLSN